nr:tripartite tricarboxylate transporter substrate-binding protein [Halomonas socia]
MSKRLTISRRTFMAGTAGAAGMLALGKFGTAFAEDYSSRNVHITIPTGEGGGADRDARAFTRVWQNHLNTSFEFSYQPGASGEVGYQFYMDRDPDAFNLLFANLGPEIIMLATQNPGIELRRDIVFIRRTLSEPMSVWVGPNSRFENVEQLVEEAQNRPVTVAVSRLPHPASIGMLALAEETGANFNLVPFGGGNPSAMAAITGEVDCCALPVTNTIALGDDAKVLGLFSDSNPAPSGTNDAPTINSVFGTSIPELTSSRAWGVQREAYDNHPDRVARLKETIDATFDDPEYEAAVEASGVPAIFIRPGNEEEAMAEAELTLELAERFKDLLAG